MEMTALFRVGVLVFGLAAWVVHPTAEQTLDGQRRDIQASEEAAYVANLSGDNVTAFVLTSGTPLGEFVARGAGGLSRPTGLAFSPDGAFLLVSSSGTGQILRFDGRTGRFIDVFVADPRLQQPFSLVFDADGDLYVSDGATHSVLRFSGATGDFVGVVASSESLQTPIGLDFRDDGLLFVANAGGQSVKAFEPVSGREILSVVHEALRFPSDVRLGTDSLLYVSSAFTSQVLAFDAQGTLIRTVATLPESGVPVGLAFSASGALVVGDFALNRLYLVTDGGGLSLIADTDLAGPENIVVAPLPSAR